MKKIKARTQKDIPENWRDFYVCLWMEDDAQVPDKERTWHATQRMTQGPILKEKMIHVYIKDDLYVKFFTGGWVELTYPEGGEVGVLVKPDKLEPMTPEQMSPDIKL